MKLALVTTTITFPEVLRLYRACSPDVRFFIAGDHRSPHHDIIRLCDQIGNAHYIFPTDQARWKCSELIGWNSIQRRNIATLEALEWGADIIVSVDTDNFPMSTCYFDFFQDILENPFNGLRVSKNSTPWFNPTGMHRGFPLNTASSPIVEPVVNVKVGVATGAIMGDPDVSALTRIVMRPECLAGNATLDAGFVVDPAVHTVFNSQNTAIMRELAPAFFMFPGVGRYDDIYASILCQRIMRETQHHVHFGRPYAYQQRHEHNLIADLEGELYGMKNLKRFAEALDDVPPLEGATLERACHCMGTRAGSLLPERTLRAWEAWAKDVESIL